MFKKLFVFFAIFLTACSWHFKNNEMLPPILRTLSFESADQHSEVSRVLRQQLLLNDVKLVPKNTEVAHLRLNNATTQSHVASLFKQAREAEKILSLTMQASVSLPNQGSYPLEVTVHRTFFDDSRAALAKSAEQDAIVNAMYEQASRQLIIKMAAIQKELKRAE